MQVALKDTNVAQLPAASRSELKKALEEAISKIKVQVQYQLFGFPQSAPLMDAVNVLLDLECLSKVTVADQTPVKSPQRTSPIMSVSTANPKTSAAPTPTTKAPKIQSQAERGVSKSVPSVREALPTAKTSKLIKSTTTSTTTTATIDVSKLPLQSFKTLSGKVDPVSALATPVSKKPSTAGKTAKAPNAPKKVHPTLSRTNEVSPWKKTVNKKFYFAPYGNGDEKEKRRIGDAFKKEGRFTDLGKEFFGNTKRIWIFAFQRNKLDCRLVATLTEKLGVQFHARLDSKGNQHPLSVETEKGSGVYRDLTKEQLHVDSLSAVFKSELIKNALQRFGYDREGNSRSGWDEPAYSIVERRYPIPKNIASRLNSGNTHWKFPAGHTLEALREIVIHYQVGNWEVLKRIDQTYGIFQDPLNLPTSAASSASLSDSDDSSDDSSDESDSESDSNDEDRMQDVLLKPIPTKSLSSKVSAALSRTASAHGLPSNSNASSVPRDNRTLPTFSYTSVPNPNPTTPPTVFVSSRSPSPLSYPSSPDLPTSPEYNYDQALNEEVGQVQNEQVMLDKDGRPIF